MLKVLCTKYFNKEDFKMALKPYEVCKIKREALGLTQAELASYVGCTGGSISMYESGKEVSELVYKGIGWALKDLESKLSPEKFNDYKLRVGANCVISEPNDKLKVTKIHNLMFNCLKYLQYLEAKERGDL